MTNVPHDAAGEADPMSTPEIPGYQIESLIGKGASGVVYAARHESGSQVAIKVLDPRACNPRLISNRVNRLYAASPPKTAVPLVAYSLEREPYLLIHALLADRVVQGIGVRYVPRTLQLQLGDYLGKRSSWMFVRKLAQVLAEFHRRRVAHGNLKPGNIFFDSEGAPLLMDYTQGLMPGLDELSYTDALLYAPPEQLTNPDGYKDGAGYGWDVYAFGVLAFRLLTGVFPRCNDTFEQVAPAVGEQRRPGVEADCARVASKLQTTPVAEWQGDAPTREEEEGRSVIERCLELDPWKRYPDMREVLRALETIASSRQAREARQEEEERVKVLSKRRNRWRAMAGLGLAACATLGAVVGYQKLIAPEGPVVATTGPKPGPGPGAIVPEPAKERDPSTAELALDAKTKEIQQVIAERDRLAQDSDELRAEYDALAADLATAFELSDTLMSWSVERGAVDLPTLEGRAGRLKILEATMQSLLKRSEDESSMQRHRWRIKLALAEIALAAGESTVARERLGEVIAEAPADDEATLRRVTRARVLSCLIGSRDPDIGVSETELMETETILASLPEEDRETRRLKSALKLAEARMKGRAGDATGALDTYRTAFSTMTELCEEQPLLGALRLWRARGYSEAAQAAAGDGAVDAALLLREQAAAELLELLQSQSNKAEVQVELSMALGAIAESALESGEIERAEDLAARSLELLKAAIDHPEESAGALIQLATQKSVLAACWGEIGRRKDALKLVGEGVEHVGLALKLDAADPLARYRLAILKWQEAGIRNRIGAHNESVRLGTEARSLLMALQQENVLRPSPLEIQRAFAYLTSDLGHSAQLAGRDGEAIRYFGESVKSWKSLTETDAGNAEFQEGLEWAQLQLRELGVMSSLPKKTR